jgi:hypothetical protein
VSTVGGKVVKVRIDAGGREVEVETASDQNVSVADVAKEALTLWEATDGAKEPTQPAYGFSADRRGWQVSPMSMGGYGGAHVEEPKAERSAEPEPLDLTPDPGLIRTIERERPRSTDV